MNPYMRLRITLRRQGSRRQEGGKKVLGVFSANGIYTVFFLCSRKFKITNHRPQAVSLKEPKTPISFLKQVCEDLETVGPIVSFLFFSESFNFSEISWFWF